MGRFPFLDYNGPAAFAHRGGTSEFPENTLAAFSHAVEIGYRYVETDVHLTTDGHLVAYHDPEVAGSRYGRRPISELTLAEVRSVTLTDGAGERHPIPTLDEILGAWPDLRVNIDPKTDAAVEPLIDKIKTYKAIDRVCVGSFLDRRIRACRKALGPDLCTSMGPLEMARFRAGSFGLPHGRFTAGCLQVPEFFKGHHLLDQRLVSKANELGLQVHVWTINTETDMHRFLDLGVDAVMTDELPLLRDVLTQRGEWR